MGIEIQQSLFEEVADFIVSQPSLEEIRAYRVSQAFQQRVDNLLEKNRESGLAPVEQEEMEKILTISHLMSLAKVKARLKLAAYE